MTPTTYGRDFAYCLKSHGGVRGFNASLWRFLLRCTLFCHSVATFLTSVSSYEGGCGFEDFFSIRYYLAFSGHFNFPSITKKRLSVLISKIVFKKFSSAKIRPPLSGSIHVSSRKLAPSRYPIKKSIDRCSSTSCKSFSISALQVRFSP